MIGECLSYNGRKRLASQWNVQKSNPVRVINADHYDYQEELSMGWSLDLVKQLWGYDNDHGEHVR
jgi:hypothetical protein